MTRPGRAAAAASATSAKGQAFASLHAWNVASERLRRQPVSPITTMRRGAPFGTGRTSPATDACAAPEGSGPSQTRSGNAEGFDSAGELRGGRSGTVAGSARTRDGRAEPATTNSG